MFEQNTSNCDGQRQETQWKLQSTGTTHLCDTVKSCERA